MGFCLMSLSRFDMLDANSYRYISPCFIQKQDFALIGEVHQVMTKCITTNAILLGVHPGEGQFAIYFPCIVNMVA